MAHPFKQVAQEFLEAIQKAGPEMGEGLAKRMDDQAVKLRKNIEEIRARDRSLADGQSTPQRPRDHDAPDRVTPNADGPVQPLDVDTYDALRGRAEVGDGLEHDHMPSAAALIRARELELGRKLKPHERTALYNNAASMELPQSVHRGTRTYGGRNTQTQINADAADLSAAANADYTDRIALLLERGVPMDDIETAIRNIMAMNRERGIG